MLFLLAIPKSILILKEFLYTSIIYYTLLHLLHTTRPTIQLTHSVLLTKKMGDGGGPRDAAFIEGLLQETDAKEYDPLVVHQLLEVSYSEERL